MAEIILDTEGVRLPEGLTKAQLQIAAERCAALAERRAQPEAPWREITLHVTHDAENQEVNRRILGHDYATDVITQAYEPFPFEPPGLVAELYVNVDEARRNAERLGRTTWAEELLLYIAHGCDHLTGADDATPAQRQAMRRRDLRWMRLAAQAAKLP